MYKFDKIIQEALNFNKVFASPSNEEQAKRQQELIDDVMSKVKKTKLPDGSWHVHENVFLSNNGKNFKSLKNLNISIVDGSFFCYNNGLVSLVGCPKKVKEHFSCSNNKLTSLEGCPKVVGESFRCYHNPTTFTIEDVESKCDVGGQIYVD